MGVGLRRDHLQFGHRKQRKEADEEKEEDGEEAEGAEEREDIHDRRAVVTPAGRQVVVGERGDGDHEALEPHADVDEEADDPDEGMVLADLLEPEELRGDHVAGDHDPIGPGILSEGPVHEGELLEGVARVGRDEELGGVRVADHRARGQDDLTHVVDVVLVDDVMQAIDRAQRQHQGQHHREAGEDGAGDEVRREDGRVPARDVRDGEVERDDGVHGKHERGREARKEQVRHLEVGPLAVTAAPTHGQQAVERLAPPGRGPVADDAEVRDHAHVPEERGDGEVGRDCEDVPLKRGAELHPDTVLIGQREEPPAEPHATDVEEREETRATDREDGHGLGGAIDGRAPLLAEEAEDRRDQRAGVADADPEDEVDDGPTPTHGRTEAPGAGTGRDEVAEADERERRDEERDAEHDLPPERGLFFDDATDLVRDPVEAAVIEDQRGARELGWTNLIEDRGALGRAVVGVSHGTGGR